MSRIPTVTRETADTEQAALLEAIAKDLGMVPNFLAVLATSPESLKAFLGLHGIAGHGRLDGATRERIAIAIAQSNNCQYCLSAHTTMGRKAGLGPEEIAANRRGMSHDAKAAAAVRFARALNETIGSVTDADFTAIRSAGYDDPEIIEIVTHVAMNVFTNMLNKAVQVDIDFPKVPLQSEAA